MGFGIVSRISISVYTLVSTKLLSVAVYTANLECNVAYRLLQ